MNYKNNGKQDVDMKKFTVKNMLLIVASLGMLTASAAFTQGHPVSQIFTANNNPFSQCQQGQVLTSQGNCITPSTGGGGSGSFPGDVFVNESGDTMSGNLDMGGNNIIGLNSIGGTSGECGINQPCPSTVRAEDIKANSKLCLDRPYSVDSDHQITNSECISDVKLTDLSGGSSGVPNTISPDTVKTNYLEAKSGSISIQSKVDFRGFDITNLGASGVGGVSFEYKGYPVQGVVLNMNNGHIRNVDKIGKSGQDVGIGFFDYGVGIGPNGGNVLEVKDDKVEIFSPLNMNDENIKNVNKIGKSGQDIGIGFFDYGVGIGPKGSNWFEVKDGLIESFANLNMNYNNIKNVGSCSSCDLAETVEKADGADLEKGDVVSINEEGKLVKASKRYDSSVAGVVSSSPVIMMGSKGGGVDFGENIAKGKSAVVETEEGKKEVPLALAGLVPVKASATNGAIEPGDKLTTSSISGYAVKAEPVMTSNGRKVYGSGIIGKAMESLESGKGKVKMLVSVE